MYFWLKVVSGGGLHVLGRFRVCVHMCTDGVCVCLMVFGRASYRVHEVLSRDARVCVGRRKFAVYSKRFRFVDFQDSQEQFKYCLHSEDLKSENRS